MTSAAAIDYVSVTPCSQARHEAMACFLHDYRSRVMADRLIKHFWQQDARECVLFSVDGVLELRLLDGERAIQRVKCSDMRDAAGKAFDLARHRPEFENR